MPMPAAPDYENASSPFASWWLNHVAVRVPDFSAGVRWYTETLDFRLVHSWPYEGGITFGYLSPATDNRVRIELMGGPGAQRKPHYADLNDSLSLYGFHHVGFRVDDVDEAVRMLKERGVTILSEPMDFEACNRRFAVFSDPWGNIFEVDRPIVPDGPKA
ncbi:VOC family protein [Sphingomonas sp. HF-S4]|uniref:VOC family protein n=1 Tax=Sphingomonas agrestis TaxID=3080540 RepID=A0ABU3Y210_9SPHN|nr:VOC family protein [Sphingomonas sp. HF-S4]MDV3455416.1 VOC family protein [Sphingomonas sp. HF-S4]